MSDKVFGVDVSLSKNTLKDAKLHPLTTAEMDEYANSLDSGDVGIVIYNTDEEIFHIWSGTEFIHFTETDPTVPEYVKDIIETQIGDWDEAHAWGNHASAGYLTSFTESDPTVASHIKGITQQHITDWDTAVSWGDHAQAGYLTSFTESDPVFAASQAANVTQTHITKLDTRSEVVAMTICVVSALPVPQDPTVTYLVGNQSSILMNVSSMGTLRDDAVLRMRGKIVIAGTGSPSGGHYIRFNGDSGANYGFTVQARTPASSSPATFISLHNSTQLNDVFDFEVEVKTAYNENPGAGVVASYKVVRGVVNNRGTTFSTSLYTDIYGIWRNSANNITQISLQGVLNIAVGTKIEIFKEV